LETITIIREAETLSRWSQIHQRAAKSVAVVPTMGYLHEGHLSLIRAARAQCDAVIVTDFVNPTQFGPNEDYAAYPRDEAMDIALCQAAGADVVFIPDVHTLYPNGQDAAWVDVKDLGDHLCGASRPGHFRGVATVVMKLLCISRADFAFFGQKDYQQLRVVQHMVHDFGLPCQIIGCPIVREPDGLAMSSRNVRLSQEERPSAIALSQGLAAAHQAFLNGERDARQLTDTAASLILPKPHAQIEYIAVADPETLEIFHHQIPNRAIMLLAVRVGNVRLIDNMLLE